MLLEQDYASPERVRHALSPQRQCQIDTGARLHLSPR